MLAHSIALAALVAAVCPAELAAPLRGCARGAEADCAALQKRAAGCFGTRRDDDRRVGELLARRLVELMAHPPLGLASAVRACGATDCARLATIVERLFSGADHAIDRSADRAIGRALAERLVADDKETSCASR